MNTLCLTHSDTTTFNNSLNKLIEEGYTIHTIGKHGGDNSYAPMWYAILTKEPLLEKPKLQVSR